MRLSRFALVLTALVAPVALITEACAVFLDDFEKVSVIADAGSDAAPDVMEGCKSVTYPPPPDLADAKVEDGMIDFVGAVRTIDLGEKDKSPPVGIDLDNICTCLGESASCKYPPYATADHCDDPGGVDNAASKLLRAVSIAAGADKFGSDFYTDKAEKGFWTLLLRVTGYNGQPNDPQVRFILYAPQGIESSKSPEDGGICMPPGGPMSGSPCWNGDDVWHVADSSLAPMGTLDNPIYVDDNAYVADSILVANVPSANISLGGGVQNYMAIKLTAGTIMGKIEDPQDGLGFRITDGTVAGRWKTADFFASLGTFIAEGLKFCTDSGIPYTLFKAQLCKYVDISSQLGGATQLCDSLSFGMKFSTFPAKLGSIVPTATPMAQCAPGADPAMDGCDK